VAAPQSPWDEKVTASDAAASSARRSLGDGPLPRWVLLALVFVVLAVRGRVMLSMGDSLDQDPDAYREMAGSIYQDHTFGIWRYGAGSLVSSFQPTAYRPPLYPLLLSVFHFLPEVHSAYGLFHVLLGVGTALAVWRLGQLWGLPTAASLLAVALVTVDPILLNQSVQVMSETLATFLAACALVALTRAARENSLWRCALAGAALGLCVLCRPTFLAWLVGVIVVFPFVVSTDRRRRALQAAALVAGAAIVIAPWPIRNQIVFGRPIITTTHGGYTLLLGNNQEFYQYLRTGEWGNVWNATKLSGKWEGVLRGWGADEVAIDREAYHQAWENIAYDPGMFAYSCLARVGRLWAVLPHRVSPDESPSRQGLRYAVAIWYLLELLLAAAGLWFAGKRLTRAPWVWALLLLLSFTAVHALYWTDMRMRAPLMSVVALLAAHGAVMLATRRRAARPLPAEA
jgi:4-amino-4-deoxy-L-arabinose transferase-like glycosyltransferase